MHRRYNRWWSRFEQPDPYDGSYDIADPQSFNRIAYVQNDPVNFVDPTGLVTYDGAADPHLIAEGLVGGLLWAIQHGGVLAFNHGIRIGDALHAYWSFSFFTQNTGKQGGPCDQTVRDTFADDDAQAAASGFEPTGFPESAAWRNGQNRSRAGGPQPNQWGHLNGFSGHIYGSSPGGERYNFIRSGQLHQLHSTERERCGCHFPLPATRLSVQRHACRLSRRQFRHPTEQHE